MTQSRRPWPRAHSRLSSVPGLQMKITEQAATQGGKETRTWNTELWLSECEHRAWRLPPSARAEQGQGRGRGGGEVRRWEGPRGAHCLPGGSQDLLRTWRRRRTRSCHLAPVVTKSRIMGMFKEPLCGHLSRGAGKQVPAGQEAGLGDRHILACPWVPSVGKLLKQRASQPHIPAAPPWSISARNQGSEPQTTERMEALSWTPPTTPSHRSWVGKLGQRHLMANRSWQVTEERWIRKGRRAAQ